MQNPGDRTLSAAAGVNGLTFTKDSRTLLAYCQDHRIRFFDVAGGQMTKEAAWNGDNRRAVRLAGRKHLLAAGNDHSLHVYDLETGSPLHTLTGATSAPGRLAISSDGKWLASSSAAERTVRLWDLSQNRQVRALPDGIGGASEIAFSLDGSRLVVANYDTDVRVFDTRTGELIRKIEDLPVSMFALTFSSDGKYLASAGVDRIIYLWDARQWTLLRKLTGSPHMISALSFSPDGRLLIAGGFDETTFRNPVKVQFWDVAAGSVVRTADSPHRVTAAVFSADGSWAATATGSKEVQVWKAPRPGQ